MRKLIPYLKHYKKESIIGPLFKLLEAVFELIVPLITAKIIDVGIQNQDCVYIWKMAAILVAFGILWAGVLFTCPVFCGKGGSGIWDGTAS